MKDSLTPFLKALQKNVIPEGMAAMQMSVDHARDKAKKEHRYKDQTGGLTANTISKPVTLSGLKVIGEIGNASQLALFIHEGTGLYGPDKQTYKIVPKKAASLAYEIPAGMGGSLAGNAGELIFRKSVQHPGIKPDPFIATALHETKPFFIKMMQAAFSKAVRISTKK